jgi:hypothetical protein
MKDDTMARATGVPGDNLFKLNHYILVTEFKLCVSHQEIVTSSAHKRATRCTWLPLGLATFSLM